MMKNNEVNRVITNLGYPSETVMSIMDLAITEYGGNYGAALHDLIEAGLVLARRAAQEEKSLRLVLDESNKAQPNQ